ncbi:hypothetical protein [Dongia deserti]|uniref:hypothetical protein n=1 Tax=Dongia deserti TaxID=2268030 RepID=UPI000E65ACDC|nr:hypothetical protein [Dongia deserti]
MRLLLSYLDQNEELAGQLPRRGTIERLVRSSNDIEWALVHLDQPIEYQNSLYQRVLLRSRWHGFPLGGEQATSVHILLAPSDAPLDNGFAVDPANHVAWGMAERLLA